MGLQDKQASRYYAYFNYFLAIQKIITSLYPLPSDLIGSITELTGYKRLKKKPNVDEKRIAELLHSSWFTWGLLEEIGQTSQLAHLNSPWSFVQSYYSIYAMLDAFLVARGQVINPHHATILRAAASELTNQQPCFPAPSICTFSGDPKINLIQLNNSSSSIFTLTNPLASPYDNPQEHYALFLKTTRKKMLKLSIDGWKKRMKRKRILSHERQELLDNLRATTIFDALYRVRTRSNYRDIDAFAFGISAWGHINGDSLKLHGAVLQLTEYSLLIIEVLIARIMGKNWMLNEMEKFSMLVHAHPIQKTILKHHLLIRQT